MKTFALSLLVLLAGCKKAPADDAPVRVAAASDLAEVFPVLATRFEAGGGRHVEFTFGSSGLLARQLAEGAPFDVFASASPEFLDQAVTAGACDGATSMPLVHGRLAVWPPGLTLETLVQGDGKIAIANPGHAPYGRAAKQALERAGLWAGLEKRVVLADNVRQAVQYVDSGNARGALVAVANVVQRDAGAFTVIDASLHEPIEQRVVRCGRGARPDDAQRFLEFLKTPAAREVLLAAGFEP
ncbi:MAG: molybdate ABC transporter substrate-binding protein [Myxococcaceae bacterium]